MSSTYVAMGIAILLSIIIVVKIGVVSLALGGLHFLFAKPKLEILRSEYGKYGFSFGFSFNGALEPSRFNTVRLRLYNPFGEITQVDVSQCFNAASDDFSRDLDMGKGMENLVNAISEKSSTVEIQVSTDCGITHQYTMKGKAFLEKKRGATMTADEYLSNNKVVYAKPVFQTATRSFIATPLETNNKTLKIATNPQFAGEFQGEGSGAGAAEVPNFAILKVWIEPGCIVCNACEDIYPEVFEVTADSCLIRPDAPLDNGLKILEASDACPVEVIKFDNAV